MARTGRRVFDRQHDVEEWKLPAGAEAGIYPGVECRQDDPRINVVAQIERQIVRAEAEALQRLHPLAAGLTGDFDIALADPELVK